MFDDILDVPTKVIKKVGLDLTQLQTGYVCPAHGDIGYGVLTSTIIGHEGVWCMVCILEALEKLGLQKL